MFLICIDWLTMKVTEGTRGIHLTFTTALEDIDFICFCLISHTQQHMQEKTDKPTEKTITLGLRPSKNKATRAMIK